MATKQELMEALKALESGKGGNKTTFSGGDNASYPFWNIDVGAQATLRFLPDKDPNNTFFWANREVIKLPFDGVEGGEHPTNKQVTVQVPCVEMWGDTCPILTATRPWWKDPAKEATARLYWKKKSYIFQGFVVNSPFEEQNLPENPIRRFMINPSIFDTIKNALMDPEMEEMPTDYVGGVDFNIRKTKKGDYSNYSTSDWARRSRSLGESEMAAIEQYGLHNLADFKGTRPDADGIAAIKAMFEDSVAGRPFDFASFGQFYRPFSDREEGSTAPSASSAAAPSPSARVVAEARSKATEEDAVAAPVASASRESPQEILERIKNRTLNKN